MFTQMSGKIYSRLRLSNQAKDLASVNELEFNAALLCPIKT